MLAILGVAALVLGVFLAGGGAFDWEFLFSDGYREHPWVRSAGRGGARGLMLLVGSVLAIGGFVSQVVDAASRPVVIAARDPANAGVAPSFPPEQTAREAPAAVLGSLPEPAAPNVTAGPMINGSGPASRGTASPATGRATARNDAPGVGAPTPTAGGQPMTIYSPDVVVEESQTLVILQYRFAPRQGPLPGGVYHWVIALGGVSHEIAYEADVLQQEGQLTQVFSDATRGEFNGTWSTWIDVATTGRRKQVSNSLQISPAGAQSKPLTTP